MAAAEIEVWSLDEVERPPRFARAVLRAFVTAHDVGIHPSDAELAVSELVTNAFEHARAPRLLVLERVRAAASDPGGLRIQVEDGSPVLPVASGFLPTDANGRGLAIVAALTSEWGVDLTTNGKCVWLLFRPARNTDRGGS